MLTHLIANAGSSRWHGTQTARHWPVEARTRPSNSGTPTRVSACRPWPGTQICEIFFFSFCRPIFFSFAWVASCADSSYRNRRVFSVVYSPDGIRIASGSFDKTLKIWNAQTGQCVSTRGHSEYVAAISYSCLFSSVWCVLTIEHFTGLSSVFASDRMASTLLVEAGTKPSGYGRRRRAIANRRALRVSLSKKNPRTFSNNFLCACWLTWMLSGTSMPWSGAPTASL